MRLDEWQRLLESEFVEERAAKAGAGISVEIQPALFTRTDGGGQAEKAASGPVDSESSAAAMAAFPDVRHNEAPAAIAQTQDQGPETVVEPMSPVAVPASEVQVSTPPIPVRRLDRVATTQAGSAVDDVMVAPFADYITARLGGSEQSPSPGLEDPPAAQGTVTMAGGFPRVAVASMESAAAEPETNAERIHADSYPLFASSHILARLRQGGDSAVGQDVAIAQRREALARRLLDPVLSLDETALLLDVPMPVVRQYADHNTLEPCEPSGATNSSVRGTNPETSPLNFRLSDIVAFLETRAAATETTNGAGQDRSLESE